MLDSGSARSTIRGMDVWGFDEFEGADIRIVGGGRDTIVGNRLATRPSPSVSGPEEIAIDAERGATGGNVIQSNVVGASFEGRPAINLLPDAGGDTIGGPGPGQGNTMTDTSVELGAHSVVPGNTLTGVDVSTGAGSTVGGPPTAPGTGAGNTINGDIVLGNDSVAQGNRIDANGRSGIALSRHDTAGGAQPRMGNLILGGLEFVYAGISVDDVLGTPSFGSPHHDDGNVIENNTIEAITTAHESQSIGAIAIVSGTGNHVFDNTLRDDSSGIILGNGAYLYNGLHLDETDPNLHQPYALLFDAVARGGRIGLSGRLTAHGNSRYTIDLYEQPSCAQNSITPGVGQHDLGREHVHTDAFGDALFTLSFPEAPRAGAVSATATAPNGSTSEFSPCLTVGRGGPDVHGHRRDAARGPRSRPGRRAPRRPRAPPR